MTETVTEKVTIDIWSDVMCPWCLIGWGQLTRGLEMLDGEIDAEIRWRPFELNPDMPAAGEEQSAHIARKYQRTEAQTAAVRDQMRMMAGAAGVSLDYVGLGEEEPPAMMWNTFLAHKLLRWALVEKGWVEQTKLKLSLFTAHFNARRNVSDPRVLADIAVSQGFDRDAASAAMLSEEIGEVVRAEQKQAWDMNITGVPAMVVDEKFLIPGAQQADTYANALRKIVGKRRTLQ